MVIVVTVKPLAKLDNFTGSSGSDVFFKLPEARAHGSVHVKPNPSLQVKSAAEFFSLRYKSKLDSLLGRKSFAAEMNFVKKFVEQAGSSSSNYLTLLDQGF